MGGGVGRNVKEEKQNKRNESIRPLPSSVKKKIYIGSFCLTVKTVKKKKKKFLDCASILKVGWLWIQCKVQG